MAKPGAKKRLIIDTDPGIDDAMAIACAFNSPEVDVIGLTTIFGNVHTAKATENAFFLLDLAGRKEVQPPQGRGTYFERSQAPGSYRLIAIV